MNAAISPTLVYTEIIWGSLLQCWFQGFPPSCSLIDVGAQECVVTPGGSESGPEGTGRYDMLPSKGDCLHIKNGTNNEDEKVLGNLLKTSGFNKF